MVINTVVTPVLSDLHLLDQQGLAEPAPIVSEDHPWVVRAAADISAIPLAVMAGSVVDPEIPVLTIADLGVLRSVRLDADGSVQVAITPTYSGCPAVQAMSDDIRTTLQAAGYPDVTVRTELSPAWTTDDMTETARDALRRFGIAPPGPVRGPVGLSLAVRCPQCGSRNTVLLTRFGSTSCKSLYRCADCLEPFDHFKPL